jgi:hypothetical protein
MGSPRWPYLGEVSVGRSSGAASRMSGQMVAAIVREFGGFRIDTTDWPIILMEIPDRRMSDTDFHAGLSYVEQLWRECQRMGFKSYQVVDLTCIREIAPTSQRKHAADWIKSTDALMKLVSLGGRFENRAR